MRKVKYIVANGAKLPEKSDDILAKTASPTPIPPGVIGMTEDTFPRIQIISATLYG